MKNKLLVVSIAILSLSYLANCFTTFRLANDSIRYFILMEKWAGVWPSEIPVVDSFLPFGYVSFLLVLFKFHILTSFTIVLSNCLYLFGSLVFLNGIFRRDVNIKILILFVLLSWLSIKFTLLPLSEMQYLFFSLGALYYFSQFQVSNKKKYLVYAALFCAVSVFTRTAGISLVLALCMTLVLKSESTWKQWCRRHKLASVIILSTLICVVLVILTRSPYFDFVWAPFANNPAQFAIDCFVSHLLDWSEVFVNVPFSKVSSYAPGLLCKIVYISTGLCFLFLLFYGLLKRKFQFDQHIKIYFVLYLLVIFNWPFFDARFWFPIMPIIFAALLQFKVMPFILRTFAFLYIILGIFSIGYYSFLTFNKHALANKLDSGKWKPEYNALFSQQPYDSATIDKRALYILRKYN